MYQEVEGLKNQKFKAIIDKVYSKIIDKDMNGETILKSEVEIELKK